MGCTTPSEPATEAARTRLPGRQLSPHAGPLTDGISVKDHSLLLAALGEFAG